MFFSSVKKTPTLLQMEAVECGAAALGMVLSYFGLIRPLEELRLQCGVSRDGSTALNVLKAGRHYNMEGRGFRSSAEDLAAGKTPMPLIIHWNFNHFVVLEGFRGGRALLNDPASGHRKVPMDEFKRSFTGVALSFKPGNDFKKGGKKFSVVGDIVHRLMNEKPALLFIMTVGLLMILPGLAQPVFNQIFIDDVLSLKHTDWLMNLLLAMGIACLADGALNFLRSWCLVKWQAKLTVAGSGSFFMHVMRLPIAFFQQRFSGEIAMRVGFNEQVATVLTGEAATAALDLFVTLFYLLLLLQYSVRLTVIGILFSAMNFALLHFIRKHLREISLRMQQESGKAMGTAVGGLQIIETLKANGNEADFFSKWAGYNAKIAQGRMEMFLISQAMVVGPALLNAINTALIMILGGFQIMDGVMSAGIFIAFRSLMGNFQAPLGKIMNLGSTLQQTEMQMQRLNDVLRYDTDKVFYPDTPPAPTGRKKLTGLVELRDVTFGYSPLADPLIENFNLTLEPGRWVALVGGSGSGKSTVARVVTGLQREWSGKILFDGMERTEIPGDVLVNSIAAVDQEIFLFSGTVKENLSLFNSSIPQTDIVAAAMDAAIHDDITNLEGGYSHKIREGGRNFSGGQRQRLEIARALACSPSILIFDEATSALDPVTEEIVMTNIRRRGCACLMVAHRLSAFRDCDEIIVLEYGKVVQRGTHSGMIAVDGPYRKLVAQQIKQTKKPADGERE
ncbi:MAG: NHLP family bacteriocin export ABC transporter peptidase/permease/ATPase subunit [Synergistaceae bacterium]|jgi:NHLM bacteriocin system ABC transporter peptidase/ATP-binding protein|nr:NHLP family bacteriocin export ABC transporter peptidase/permease/ATPase subunit [Synergistaceae bacterium]